ncbi:MAG TPA: chorismate mutase [Terriglobales bacterium]|nr:chorismate mutase [Terriglobales bacterium]
MNLDQEIGDWRREIDQIDGELLGLLNRRAEIASRVLKLKRNAGLAICDPQRELEVVCRARQDNPGPLDGQAIERIFRCIVHEVRNAEELENERLTAQGEKSNG